MVGGVLICQVLIHLIVVGALCPCARWEQKSAKVNPMVRSKNIVVLHPTMDVHPDLLRRDPFQLSRGKRFHKVPVGPLVWRHITLKDILAIPVDKRRRREPAFYIPFSHITLCYTSNIDGRGSPGIFDCRSYFQRFPYYKRLPVCVGLCLHQDMEPSTLAQNSLFVRSLEGRFSLPNGTLHSCGDPFVGLDNCVGLRRPAVDFQIGQHRGNSYYYRGNGDCGVREIGTFYKFPPIENLFVEFPRLYRRWLGILNCTDRGLHPRVETMKLGTVYHSLQRSWHRKSTIG
jgi:hypothetical protein